MNATLAGPLDPWRKAEVSKSHVATQGCGVRWHFKGSLESPWLAALLLLPSTQLCHSETAGIPCP